MLLSASHQPPTPESGLLNYARALRQDPTFCGLPYSLPIPQRGNLTTPHQFRAGMVEEELLVVHLLPDYGRWHRVVRTAVFHALTPRPAGDPRPVTIESLKVDTDKKSRPLRAVAKPAINTDPLDDVVAHLAVEAGVLTEPGRLREPYAWQPARAGDIEAFAKRVKLANQAGARLLTGEI